MSPSPIDQAAEPVTQRRAARDVLLDAVDLFCRSDGHERGAVRAFGALVGGLLDEASPAERRQVAEKLAPRADTPPEVARRLATDAIAIAESMIERSPVLTSSDLVEILRCGPGHVRAVTRRLDLAPDVAAVLIDSSVAAPRPRRETFAETRRTTDRAAPTDTPREQAMPETNAPLEAPPTASEPSSDAVARWIEDTYSAEATRGAAPERAAEPPAPTPAPLFRVPVRAEVTPTTAEPPAPRLDGRARARTHIALDSAGRWRALQAATLEAMRAPAAGRRGVADPEALGDRLLGAAVLGVRRPMRDDIAAALGLAPSVVEEILAEPSGEVLAVTLVACGIGDIRTTSILIHHLGARATHPMLQDLVALVERTPRRAAETLVASWCDEPVARRFEVLRQTDAAERREGAVRERGERGERNDGLREADGRR